MRPIDVIPAIADRLLATVYNHVNIAGPAKFKVGNSVRDNKYKTLFETGYMPNWITEVFKNVKMQRINPITYLLEDHHKKSVAGTFYKHELHCANYPDVFILLRKYCAGGVMRFMWNVWDLTKKFAQLLDT